MLRTVFLYCCLRVVSCTSLTKARNVLPTPYLRCNKVPSRDFCAEFICQEHLAMRNRSLKVPHFPKPIESQTATWWAASQGSRMCLSPGDGHSHTPRHGGWPGTPSGPRVTRKPVKDGRLGGKSEVITPHQGFSSGREREYVIGTNILQLLFVALIHFCVCVFF